jgi:hypothetical protein
MPFVDVDCPEHGRLETFHLHIPATDAFSCPICGEPASRAWTWNGGFTLDFRDGYDAGAGAHFNTARERDNHLAEKGLVKRD